MTVRARLREVLDAAGDKPSDAARKTKVPYSTIHEILSGKARAPTGETLKKIAEVYDVTVGWLLGIEGQSGDYEKRVARQVLKESAPEYGGADEPTRERETAALDSANRAYALIAHLEVELGTNRIQLPDAFGMAKDESEASAFNAEERQDNNRVDEPHRAAGDKWGQPRLRFQP